MPFIENSGIRFQTITDPKWPLSNFMLDLGPPATGAADVMGWRLLYIEFYLPSLGMICFELLLFIPS